MVDEVGTHTGTVGDDRQAERAKVPGRADPAAQQDRRAAVRAGPAPPGSSTPRPTIPDRAASIDSAVPSKPVTVSGCTPLYSTPS
jgi:hypothetical protein